MTQNCGNCKFFRERANKPTDQSYGYCAWLPKRSIVDRTHWCGQFKQKSPVSPKPEAEQPPQSRK
jgi:High potential iron-sulfur protein